jgi:threonyl-tRNA synthetase
MTILHRMAMAASNSFLSTPLLRPSVSQFPKRLVSIPTFCHYANMKKKKMHTAASSAIATESSESAALSQDDNVKTKKTTTQNEKTDKLILPTNESSEILLRVRHTVMYSAITGPWL